MTAPATTSRPSALRRIAPLLLVGGLLLSLLTACDDGASVDVTIGDDGDTTQVETAGFFSGLWDGIISPFTGIVSLFDDVEVYDDDAAEAYPIGFGLGVFLIAMLLLGAITGPRYYRRRY